MATTTTTSTTTSTKPQLQPSPPGPFLGGCAQPARDRSGSVGPRWSHRTAAPHSRSAGQPGRVGADGPRVPRPRPCRHPHRVLRLAAIQPGRCRRFGYRRGGVVHLSRRKGPRMEGGAPGRGGERPDPNPFRRDPGRAGRGDPAVLRGDHPCRGRAGAASGRKTHHRHPGDAPQAVGISRTGRGGTRLPQRCGTPAATRSSIQAGPQVGARHQGRAHRRRRRAVRSAACLASGTVACRKSPHSSSSPTTCSPGWRATAPSPAPNSSKPAASAPPKRTSSAKRS